MSLADEPAAVKLKSPRRLGRLLLMIFAGLIVFVAAIIALVMWATGDIADTGKEFFARIRAGDSAGAYEMTTPAFRQSATRERFQEVVKQYRLEGAQAPSWSNRSIEGTGENARGVLKGSLRDSSGASQSIELQLAKQEGKWRVQHLDFAASGIAANPRTPAPRRAIPEERELVRLVHESNLVFARAARDKSMRGFHAHIAERFRAGYSIEALDKAFAPMMSDDVNLIGIEHVTPAFDAPPAASGPDTFKISGVYETRPSRVYFDHTYLYEGLGWKLIAYNIRIRPVEMDHKPQ